MIVRLANVVAKARQGKGWNGMEWNGCCSSPLAGMRAVRAVMSAAQQLK